MSKKKKQNLIQKGMGWSDGGVIKASVDTFKDVHINIRFLISEPDIELGNSDNGDNTGEHGSKDYVQDVIKKIRDNLIIKNFIKQIHSSYYNSNKRGCIMVKPKPSNHNQYSIYIYSKSDAGHGAEIECWANEKWKVIIIAKIIKAKITEYNKNYRLEVK